MRRESLWLAGEAEKAAAVMAGATGAPRWEVVRKAGRRSASGGPAGRKALGEANAGRGVPAPLPLATSETLFELGFEKTVKKQNKEQVPPPPGTQQQKKQNTGKNAKKAPATDARQKETKFRTLEEALKALDVSELQKELDKSLSMFPENPSVWLKDLAGYLNYKLQSPKSDPTLSQHPHDYPICLINKELRNVIKSLLSKAAGVLELFFDHCIYTMLQELDKTPGESLHGYRICIQAVLLDKPRVATADLSKQVILEAGCRRRKQGSIMAVRAWQSMTHCTLFQDFAQNHFLWPGGTVVKCLSCSRSLTNHKYLELLRSHQSRPAKCLTIMWALGQAGFADLTEGLKVWLGIMLPVLGIKSLSPFAITFLDRLLMMHPNLTKGFGMIGPKDFFPLLDFAFMPNNSLSPSLQDQLRQLYPRLKVLGFGAKPETTLHTYFPSFLSRTLPSCPADMRKELLNCLTECLNLDPLSFSVWKQLYVKHLSQSSLLLNHFLDTWDKTSKKVRKSLQETVHSFKVTNDELALKGPNNAEDVAACQTVCKSLLLKMKTSRFPWLRLALVFLVFSAGFLMHDMRTHGSFQASASARVLRYSGILSASQQAWNKVSHFSAEGYSWLEANVPLYYSHVATVLGPNLELAWAKTNETATYISGKCSAQLAWLRYHLPTFIDWLQTRIPDVVLQGAEYLKDLLLFLMRSCFLPAVDYVATSLEGLWQRWVASCNGEGSWDCLRKQLTRLTLSSWSFLQDTTVAIKDWALAIISDH
ncbi:transmembrane protein 214 isoform X1 [Sceloporus undulatus]|uniref:transmembrane protein 214 isoform X1 n=1 Tax=Sceloporus undulatus TaxID=8520 RepID=UPI001C4B197C|nr:transmembrane protein 214 isoform X1 [Sceloporus undulatus]